MSEHTPGPWYVTPVYMPYDYEDAYGGKPVCWRVTNGDEWYEDGDYDLDVQVDTCEADARILAAAPELLEALYQCERAITDWNKHGRADAYNVAEKLKALHELLNARDSARAAIAKARGEG